MTIDGPVTQSRILLGHIAGAHGIKGEVLVKSYTGDPLAIADYGPLTDERGRTFEIASVRASNKGVIARLKGVADRNASEALKGVALYVDRAAMPDPDEGDYYHTDLIGLAAVDAQGNRIGKVVAVQNFGAGDLLELRLDGAKLTEFVPFTDACVPVVDIKGGRVTIVLPETAGSQDEESSQGNGDDGEE